MEICSGFLELGCACPKLKTDVFNYGGGIRQNADGTRKQVNGAARRRRVSAWP